MAEEPKVNMSKDEKAKKEEIERRAWQIGSRCLVFSDLSGKWLFGEVAAIYNDSFGEWLRVKYLVNSAEISKDVQRFSKYIEPIYNDKNVNEQLHSLRNTEKDQIVRALFDVLDGQQIQEMMQRIKKTDLLSIISAEKGTLFDMKRGRGTAEDRVDRIKFILKMYRKWMDAQPQSDCLRMHDIMDNHLDSSYNLTHFLSDYHWMTKMKTDLLSHFVSDADDDDGCSASQCMLIDRNERDRDYFGGNRTQRDRLYFIGTDLDQSRDSVLRDISTQQMLDSLHSFLYHSMHFDVAEVVDHDHNDKDNENEVDLEHLCDDTQTLKVIEFIDRKRRNSSRFSARPNAASNDHGAGVYSKFMTTNSFHFETDILSQKFLEISSDSKQHCFVDILLMELMKFEVPKHQISAFSSYLLHHHYDSESIILDLESDSNFKSNLSLSTKFYQICSRVIVEKQIKSALYSPGYRYFYWSFYKNNVNERELLWGKVTYDENVGYVLKEWYFEKKYDNLKDELMNNVISTFTKYQFDETLFKSKQKLDAWIQDEEVEDLVCNRSLWAKRYGIKKGAPISLEHILSILCYTNFSKQCYLFSSTYRKIGEYESDQDLKRRHREFANWGRLIRETVECFGILMQHSSIDTFYHGVSDTLIFDSTSIRLYGQV